METTLNVTGMTCGHCVKHVTEALKPLPGVERVEVTLHDGRAQVAHDARTSVQALIEAVREAGYEAASSER